MASSLVSERVRFLPDGNPLAQRLVEDGMNIALSLAAALELPD
jgi:hypothetical protein